MSGVSDAIELERLQLTRAMAALAWAKDQREREESDLRMAVLRQLAKFGDEQVVREATAASPAAGKLLPKQGAGSRTDLISFGEIETLADVKLKTVKNAVSQWRKTGAKIQDPCSYVLVRPHIIKQWSGKAAAFPEDYDDMRVILKRRMAEKQQLQGSQ